MNASQPGLYLNNNKYSPVDDQSSAYLVCLAKYPQEIANECLSLEPIEVTHFPRDICDVTPLPH